MHVRRHPWLVCRAVGRFRRHRCIPAAAGIAQLRLQIQPDAKDRRLGRAEERAAVWREHQLALEHRRQQPHVRGAHVLDAALSVIISYLRRNRGLSSALKPTRSAPSLSSSRRCTRRSATTAWAARRSMRSARRRSRGRSSAPGACRTARTGTSTTLLASKNNNITLNLCSQVAMLDQGCDCSLGWGL